MPLFVLTCSFDWTLLHELRDVSLFFLSRSFWDMTSDVETSKPGQRADNCQTVGSWDDTLFLPSFYLLNSE